jgi:hypothetical protein
MTSLLVRASMDVRRGVCLDAIAMEPEKHAPVSPVTFAAGALAAKIAGLLMQFATRPEHWRVAIRRLNGVGVMESLQWLTGRGKCCPMTASAITPIHS